MAAHSKILWNPSCYFEPNLCSQCQRSAIKTAPHAVKCNWEERTILISFQPFSQGCSCIMAFSLSLSAQTVFNYKALPCPVFPHYARYIARTIHKLVLDNFSAPSPRPDKHWPQNPMQPINTFYWTKTKKYPPPLEKKYPVYPGIVTSQS